MNPGFRMPLGSYVFFRRQISSQRGPKCCFQRGRSNSMKPERYRFAPTAMLMSETMLSRWRACDRRSGGTPGRMPNPITSGVGGYMKYGMRDTVPRHGQRRTCPPPSAVGGRAARTWEMKGWAAPQGMIVSVQGCAIAQFPIRLQMANSGSRRAAKPSVGWSSTWVLR